MCADRTRRQDTLCHYPGCRRNVWQDPDGSYSSYCGTSHRDAMKDLNDIVKLCKNCDARPVYIQDVHVHDFCGRRCRDAFLRGVDNSASRRGTPAPSSPVCKLPRCHKPPFKDLDGMAGDYCSNAHRIEALQMGVAEACILCSQWPKATVNETLSNFCSKRCGEQASASAPLILGISNNTETFRNVLLQFSCQWKHPNKPAPTVVKIWKIICDKDHDNDFSRYRLGVERSRDLLGGNSRRQWHGTARCCNIGDTDDKRDMCQNDACSLCGIIRTSFRKVKAGERNNFGRFGRGIYTTGTSSKADDYVKQAGRSQYKAMLLNDVVVGKGKKMTTNARSLVKPPSGFDSVIGIPGGTLNFDETVAAVEHYIWTDPDGSYSSYCGASHRDAMRQVNGASGQQLGVRLCTNCNMRPVYVQTNQKHDFCGIRCSTAFRQGQENPGSPRASPAPASRVCKLPRCNKPTFVDPNGVPGEYCTNAHRREATRSGAIEECLCCLRWPKSVINGKTSDFCSKRCSEITFSAAPTILNVSSDMDAFRDVSKQFQDQWKHPTSVPTVHKIWKIYCDKQHNGQFSRYRLSVERLRNIPNGNSKRRWHGTIRACNIGDSEAWASVCQSNACSLCGIIKTSFRLANAGQRTNFGRFGAGIYTSATSSKANDYVHQRGRSPYKAMLLSDVVMGKAIKLTTDNVSLREAPAGYDSVVGEPGGSLKYDEAIVYKNEAIRPLFLVIYR
ncbi:hypothetical protein DAEQUDRAFT_759736 [Daedalea quercina L-15889]|uniref:PARP catalytic domain-containing protein n=1 Tax=Daedalea quercina L-15889 TaxID=1314783 RepID=A0A165LRY2_9APHY|nr:hypothetical protein DAEQUDRAFT_759736 [Daedalea quercina L-15889]